MTFSGFANAVYARQLVITGVEISGPHVIVNFTSEAGRLYRLEFTDNPASGLWNVAVDNVPGWDGIAGMVHDYGVVNAPKRFYRVVQLP